MLKRCSVKLTSKKQLAALGVWWEEVRRGGGGHGSTQNHHRSEVLKLLNGQVPAPSQCFVQDGLQVLDWCEISSHCVGLQHWRMSASAAGVSDSELVVLFNRTTASERVSPFHRRCVFFFRGCLLYEPQEWGLKPDRLIGSNVKRPWRRATRLTIFQVWRLFGQFVFPF